MHIQCCKDIKSSLYIEVSSEVASLSISCSPNLGTDAENELLPFLYGSLSKALLDVENPVEGTKPLPLLGAQGMLYILCPLIEI